MVSAETGDRVRSAAFVLTALVALGFLYVFNPSTSALYPTCPFFFVTGCYCPGCGSLRAVHQLTRGHLLTAFGLNPLLVLSLPFLAVYALGLMRIAVTGRARERRFVAPGLIWALLALILGYWVLRNIPVYPFSLLAP